MSGDAGEGGVAKITDCCVSVGDVLAARYRIERPIGVLGMSCIVSAWDERLEQRVTIRILRSSLADQFGAVVRFTRSSRLAAGIMSDYILAVYDQGVHDNVPYVVTEYAEGTSLAQLRRSLGPLSEAEIRGVALQVCQAMISAHAQGVAFQDLAAKNVYLMHRPGHPPRVKVLGFHLGDAQQGSGPTTPSRTTLASEVHQAPEQDVESSDSRVDIWGAGLLLHELFTGMPPGGERPINSDLDASPVLWNIVARCLAAVPAQRFQSASQLAEALQQLQASPDWARRFDSVLAPQAAREREHDAAAKRRGRVAEDKPLMVSKTWKSPGSTPPPTESRPNPAVIVRERGSWLPRSGPYSKRWPPRHAWLIPLLMGSGLVVAGLTLLQQAPRLFGASSPVGKLTSALVSSTEAPSEPGKASEKALPVQSMPAQSVTSPPTAPEVQAAQPASQPNQRPRAEPTSVERIPEADRVARPATARPATARPSARSRRQADARAARDTRLAEANTFESPPESEAAPEPPSTLSDFGGRR